MFAVVQGFGPFGGFPANPSELLVRSLSERGSPDIHTEVLPVSLDRVATEVPKLMEQFRPRLWQDRKSTRLNSSHSLPSRMPSSA